MDKLREELHCRFSSETGFTWINEQGEPDIDYVLWLENKLINPGFETVEQWESRTCENYPDDAPVWVLVKRWKHDDFVNDWELQTLNQTKNTIKVIANENGKPPDDWGSDGK